MKPQNAGYSKIVARLRPSVTLDQVRDDANRIRLELNPASREQVSVAVLGESLIGGMRPLLGAAVVGALLVLFVACASVATMFIGRDVARQRELAARMALGAARLQLVRSVLVETLLVALMASVAGLALGAAVLEIFVNEASGTISGLHRVGMNLPVTLAIAGLTILVTLLCGAVPGWYAARADLSPFLRRTAGSRPRAWRVRRVLVIAQIACSCVLLIGAGLLARTVSVLVRDDHGFQPNGALEAKVVLSDTVLFDGAGRELFVRGLLDRVRAMPGVQHAGFGTNLPPRTPLATMAVRFISEGRDETRFMKVGSATPGYFRALGAYFIAGRDFDDGDDRPGASVVILTESVARLYFQSKDPIGRTIGKLPPMFGMTGDARVIGVVRDIKYDGLDSPAGSAIYLPWALRPAGRGFLIVRAVGDPTRLAADIRRAAHVLDPTVPMPELLTLQDVVARSITNRRMRAVPAVGFGVLALAVAFLGVVATLATLVTERRRDLAIRSALGASPARLAWMIVGQGFLLTVVGLTIGIGVACAVARTLSSFLYRVSPYDVTTFVGTGLLIGVGTTLMTYLAAARARSVDPIAVLRAE